MVVAECNLIYEFFITLCYVSFHWQTSCRLRNFSIISVLALTVSNVFLTLRLLQVSDCGHYNDHPATSLVPKTPVFLTPATTCLEYVLSDSSVNASEKPVFSGLDLKLGRWDARRMYKAFDFAVVGEKYAELSEKLNVTLATQSSIEKIFSLVQGESRVELKLRLNTIQPAKYDTRRYLRNLHKEKWSSYELIVDIQKFVLSSIQS